MGLVGCGRWGSLILRDLVDLGAEVCVVATSTEGRRNAAEGGAAAIVDRLEALPAVEGVVVASPTTTHAAILDAVLERGAPVFVEKPMTADVASARRLAARAEGRLFVMDKWRYHPGVLALAELARDGKLGRVVGLRTVRQQPHSLHSDVDATWILAPHDLSIGLEILGAIPTPRIAHAEHVGGWVTGLVGALGTDPWLTLDLSTRHPAHRRELHLHGTDGVASLSDAYAAHVLVRRDADPGEPERIELANDLPLRAELAAFLGFLAGGAPPKSSAAEGLATVEAIAGLRRLAGVPNPIARGAAR